MIETYDYILEKMQDKFEELAGFNVDEASDIGIRLKVLAGEIFSLNNNVEWLKEQMFPQTATGSQLDYHAVERGISRKSASKSKGTLTFSINTSMRYDIEVPAGTVCSTSGVDGVRFITTEEGIITSGSTSVTVNAQSVDGGIDTNAAIGTITVMINPPPSVTAVTNQTKFAGGEDSESDESLRSRLLESYKNTPNGCNSGFYADCALKFDDVYSAKAVAKSRGAGTVDVYVASNGGVVSSSVIADIQAELDELREVNVDVQVKSPTLVDVDVSLILYVKDNYTFSDVKTRCENAITEFFTHLNIGEKYKLMAIANVIFNIEGVDNFSFGNPSYDVAISNSQLAVLGDITIVEGS